MVDGRWSKNVEEGWKCLNSRVTVHVPSLPYPLDSFRMEHHSESGHIRINQALYVSPVKSSSFFLPCCSPNMFESCCNMPQSPYQVCLHFGEQIVGHSTTLSWHLSISQQYSKMLNKLKHASVLTAVIEPTGRCREPNSMTSTGSLVAGAGPTDPQSTLPFRSPFETFWDPVVLQLHSCDISALSFALSQARRGILNRRYPNIYIYTYYGSTIQYVRVVWLFCCLGGESHCLLGSPYPRLHAWGLPMSEGKPHSWRAYPWASAWVLPVAPSHLDTCHTSLHANLHSSVYNGADKNHQKASKAVQQYSTVAYSSQ